MEKKVTYKSVEARLNYDMNTKKLKIWIPGTDSFRDVLISLNGRKTKLGNHAGIEKIGTGLANAIFTSIRILEVMYSTKVVSITIAGHSLGGSLAEFIAEDLDISGYFVDKVYLYGSYRCMTSHYMRAKIYKIIKGVDKVPYLFYNRFNDSPNRELILKQSTNVKPFRFIKDHKTYSFKEFNDA